MFPVLVPTSFVRGPAKVDHLTFALLYESFVLAKVAISVGVQKFANGRAATI
jgi:hypothetical protein